MQLTDPGELIGLRRRRCARGLGGAHPDLGDEAPDDGVEPQAPVQEDRRCMSARFVCHTKAIDPPGRAGKGEARIWRSVARVLGCTRGADLRLRMK